MCLTAPLLHLLWLQSGLPIFWAPDTAVDVSDGASSWQREISRTRFLCSLSAMPTMKLPISVTTTSAMNCTNTHARNVSQSLQALGLDKAVTESYFRGGGVVSSPFRPFSSFPFPLLFFPFSSFPASKWPSNAAKGFGERSAVCETITFESTDASSYSHIRHISGGNMGQVHIWRSSGQGQGHKSNKSGKCIFVQCKTLIGNNSGTIKHRAINFVCSMGFSTMAASHRFLKLTIIIVVGVQTVKATLEERRPGWWIACIFARFLQRRSTCWTDQSERVKYNWCRWRHRPASQSQEADICARACCDMTYRL